MSYVKIRNFSCQQLKWGTGQIGCPVCCNTNLDMFHYLIRQDMISYGFLCNKICELGG
jgi:hypothetical protein